MNDFTQFYSPEVLKHVKHPQNMGMIKNADGVATVGNPVCGDIMKFYLKVGTRLRSEVFDPEAQTRRATAGQARPRLAKRGSGEAKEEFIKDVKFQTLGCGAAIATSSMMTVLVKSRPLAEAEKISKDAIVKALGGLPPTKIHCSVLADEGLKKAIENYRKKGK